LPVRETKLWKGFQAKYYSELLSVLQKVDKSAFLILCSETEEEIRLVTKADAFQGMYSSTLLKKSEFFDNYRIESKYHNLIGLEFQLSALEDAYVVFS